MIPFLYEPNTSIYYLDNGIGALKDCISCDITEERNGAYELVMRYPMNGVFFKDIKMRSILRVIVNNSNDAQKVQFFRIYSASKPLNGVVTFKAAHSSYDLNGIPVSPFEANSAEEALDGLFYNSPQNHFFYFETDIESDKSFKLEIPASVRACLGGIDNNILSVYGGELEYEQVAIRLLKERGKDNGVEIRYGKNLLDLQQEENCSNVYTGVYPYWTRNETVDNESVTRYVELPNKFVTTSELPKDYTKIYILDLSNEFDDEPTAEQLEAATYNFIAKHNIGVPEVSITVSFIDLRNSKDYEQYKELETVDLCDTVSVFFEELGVSAKAKVVKTVWDVLTEKYKTITLGSIKETLSDLVAQQNNDIKEAQNNSQSGNINATDINLYGSFTVKNGDAVGGRLGYMSGLTGGGVTTNGIGMRSADGSRYVIVTDGGIRLQAGESSFYVTPEGCFANGNKIG